MKPLLAAVVVALSILPGASAALAAEPPRLRVTTSLGAFVIELDPERAPLTVANVLAYVDAGHYEGTLFHRVIANFVIQGGGLDERYEPKPVRAGIPNESGNGLRNVRGAVGLARAASPHSGDAQFYVNVGDNPDLDPVPSRWGYAVFGRVVEGMDVVDRIALVPTGPNGPLKSDAPLKPVVIEKIER
jgi:cyclophilin family peptidyl-prolyl cis-trans isomerase